LSRSGSVGIQAVSSPADLKDFVELPFRLYRNDPDWVPPLRSDVKWVLDEKKNPFWKHARRRLFLARKDGRTVGRVAAIVDESHNRIHADRTAFFGFFECENDAEAATALLNAAERAAREMLPGCDKLRGPANPSMNDEVGALVPSESDKGMPFLMMTHNPTYYLDLFAAAGFAKEKDLVAILAPVDDRSFKRLGRLAEAVRRREKSLVVRPIDMKRFAKELELVKVIYNGAWEKNWGFVPMTSEEIDAMAKKLKPIIYPPYILFAELDGKPAAFHLALPDFNQVLHKMGGSLFPLGWLRFLTGRKKIDRCRTMALGVLPEFRKRGIDAVLYYEAMKAGIEKGDKWVEFSWMLEDNIDILRPLEVFGGRVYRRYRLVCRKVA
jgi:GNAT superfamily N-acetyltransferase